VTFGEYLIVFFAEYLGWFLALSLIFFVFVFESRKRIYVAAEAAVSATISRLGLTELIRYFYDSPRPFEGTESVKQLIEHSSGGSFPSGHAAFFFAIATTVFIYNRRWGAFFFLGAILMGVGRVAANLHWPIDIFGGAIVGIISALLVNFIARKIKRPERS
jgi:undecaprenyl-diphosphatase